MAVLVQASELLLSLCMALQQLPQREQQLGKHATLWLYACCVCHVVCVLDRVLSFP